jgi:cell division protein ZapA
VKQIEVQIMGQGYVLGCPEGGETRLSEAVGKVDEAMCKIRDAGKIKARDRIAVLAALNLAFDLTDRPAAAQTSGESNASNASSTDLHNLLQRMDAVLARDNQLI